MGTARLQEELKREFASKDRPTMGHLLLASLRCPIYVTTNYDVLFERAWERVRASSPDSANSQCFICVDDARFLDKQYTVWGKVTSGMENVDKIKRGEPVKNPDKIIKATIS